MSRHTIHNSEFIEWTEAEGMFDDSKFHAVLCDPPYGISFMGKEWDKPDAFRRAKNENEVGRDSVFGRSSRTSPEYLGGLDFQAQARAWGEALIPLLYPGALVFMFSGTRMWHRLAAGMEDAGFKLWDTLMWLHGQGFPKGQDISKLIDKENGDERKVIGSKIGLPGYSLSEAQSGSTYQLSKHRDAIKECEITAPGSELSASWEGHKTPQLKPAWEPILCFRAPADEKYVELALKYGSGCLNVDNGRIEYQNDADKASATPQGACTAKSGSLAGKTEYLGCDDYAPDTLNPVETDQDVCTTCFYRGTDHKPRKEFERPKQNGRYPANLALDEESAVILDKQTGTLTSGKSKPEYRKRAKNNIYGNYANDEMPINVIGDSGGASRFFYCSKATQKERGAGLEGKNTHPTVKPVDLNKWLASLLLPPSSVQNRRLLVPFSGSGSEMIGAMLAGWDEVVGVEMSKEYCGIAEQRIQYWKGE